VLKERTLAETGNTDPSSEAPELEQAWRAYAKRHEVASTKDNRNNSDSTRGMVRRALRWLAERGLVQAVGEESDETFRPTSRYQIHVRQLASQAAFRELLDLGVVPGITADRTTASPTIRTEEHAPHV
jgi:hypothetical protein